MKKSIVFMSSLLFVLMQGNVMAAGGAVKSPTGTAPDRYVYYPGTEALAKDEIRLFACGTGLPAARRSQAATCWLVETGNGDKFLFDIGTGSMVNVAALMIPYDFLNKVFLTHLHTDHFRSGFSMNPVDSSPHVKDRWQPAHRAPLSPAFCVPAIPG